MPSPAKRIVHQPAAAPSLVLLYAQYTGDGALYTPSSMPSSLSFIVMVIGIVAVMAVVVNIVSIVVTKELAHIFCILVTVIDDASVRKPQTSCTITVLHYRHGCSHGHGGPLHYCYYTVVTKANYHGRRC